MTSASADVILIVDESESMKMSHVWLHEFLTKLDRALGSASFGSIRYGLIGFAGRGMMFRGRPISMGGDSNLGTLSQAQQALSALQLNGIIEDGYSAISVALDQSVYPLRSMASKIAILVTDEDRDMFDFALTRDRIQMMLSRAGVQLHSVVNVAMTGNNVPLLGISNSSAFVVHSAHADQSAEIMRPYDVAFIRRASTGHTVRDYITLALQNGGAAWDLEQLSFNVEAFTDALVKVSTQWNLS